MYSVYQHWDPLKVCVVGRSYPPEFYSFIKDTRVRSVMERIAIETEEDYQRLCNTLKMLNVEVIRTRVRNSIEECQTSYGYYQPPPMYPRDVSAMIGDTFYFGQQITNPYEYGVGDPRDNNSNRSYQFYEHQHILEHILAQGNKVHVGMGIHAANTTRVGKDLYHGTLYGHQMTEKQLRENLETRTKKLFTNYRNHIINTEGHSDGSFCPVVPGLIISISDIEQYNRTFPDWEVVHIPHMGWDQVKPFLDLKEKTKGKWWVPGEEKNDQFTDFVNTWLNDWVGYVEETVFDVNMIVVDQHNVICNNYHEKVFDAFSRYDITAHVCNFRHRYFWDGGLHCITSDLHREGTLNDYFPNRTEEIVDMVVMSGK